MDIHECTGRLKRIATERNYRISNKDSDAAGIALAIIKELEKADFLSSVHIEEEHSAYTASTAGSDREALR